jgi:putative transposase
MTDAEWEIARLHVPEPVWFPNLQEPKYPRRDILDAIFYRERTACQWRNLPHEFPPWKQVFEYYRKWRDDGTIAKLHDALRDRVREQTPHADGSDRSQGPTVCILDSQSAKTTEEGEEERGYDAGKKVKGRKRHLVIDALGLLLAIQVTSASVQDRDAALPLLKEVTREFPSLQVAFLDGAYRGEVKANIEQQTPLRVEITLRSDTQKKGSSLCRFDGSSNERSDGSTDTDCSPRNSSERSLLVNATSIYA